MLQKTMSNLQDQMSLDKASLHAKDLRIKSLEDLVIQTGVDPSNIQVAQALIKQKNEDIVALRKQLKLPQNEHPQAKEIVQEASQKDDMMNLILQMTVQIKEMEIQMDKLVHEREYVKTQEVPTVIPMETTAMPSTLA